MIPDLQFPSVILNYYVRFGFPIGRPLPALLINLSIYPPNLNFQRTIQSRYICYGIKIWVVWI